MSGLNVTHHKDGTVSVRLPKNEMAMVAKAVADFVGEYHTKTMWTAFHCGLTAKDMTKVEPGPPHITRMAERNGVAYFDDFLDARDFGDYHARKFPNRRVYGTKYGYVVAVSVTGGHLNRLGKIGPKLLS